MISKFLFIIYIFVAEIVELLYIISKINSGAISGTDSFSSNGTMKDKIAMILHLRTPIYEQAIKLNEV